MNKKILKGFVIIFAMVAVTTIYSSTTFAQGEANLKIGMHRVVINSSYTHDSSSTSGSLVGTEIFTEFIWGEHLGFEVAMTNSPISRNYNLGAISDAVSEEATHFSYGVNLYFNKASKKGIHYLAGISTGTLSVSQSFAGGSLGTATASNSLPYNVTKGGVEWTTDLGGVRFLYLNTTGDTISATALTGVIQTLDYSGSGYSLSFFAFF